MSGVSKAEKLPARKATGQELSRAPAPIATNKPALRVGQLAEAIRTSQVMQARAAAVKTAFGAALDPKQNHTGLPDALEFGIEAASGFSMDDVRVFRNSAKPAQLHLPHEAWHVVQQKRGRVKPTLQMKGVAINDDGRLEREADPMGALAASDAVGSMRKIGEGQAAGAYSSLFGANEITQGKMMKTAASPLPANATAQLYAIDAKGQAFSQNGNYVLDSQSESAKVLATPKAHPPLFSQS
jgi:hypothetical protein